MYGMTEFIVSIWLLPVTIFIIIPLIMLVTWAMLKLIISCRFNRLLLKNKKV